MLVVQKEDELGCIQTELVDTKRSHEEQISELQHDHLVQLTLLEQRLNNQHVEELDRAQGKHKDEIMAMEENHLAQKNQMHHLDCRHLVSLSQVDLHRYPWPSLLELIRAFLVNRQTGTSRGMTLSSPACYPMEQQLWMLHQ